ncbi:uncharacterized protein LOC117118161 [Anneissia japonica]|uniref:uncharacterized protein LOC117118161 n=1 Tax=Anneissia japonica TaxID=1529436 RepID=UPI001425A601|nr:uncharacterized protein LOC117118161 [Anneissia japonica]
MRIIVQLRTSYRVIELFYITKCSTLIDTMTRIVVNIMLMLEVLIDFLCIVSSRGVIDRPLPINNNCSLDIQGAEALEVLQKDGSVFINLNINFVNSSGDEILNNTGGIIDINHWVLTYGHKGVLLSKYTFDAVYLSFGTLAPGVETVSLSVAWSVFCFLNASDDEKLDIIATSIGRFSSKNGSLGLPTDYAVCLEHKLSSNSWRIFLRNYYKLKYNTYFDCWRFVPENNYSETSMYTTILLLALGSYILAQYIFFYFLQSLCRNNPIIIKKNKYISIDTDLPIGPKYAIFFQGNGWTDVNRGSKIYWIRCFLYLSLFYVSQFFPILIAHLDTENLIIKEIREGLKWDIVYGVVCYFLFLPLSILYLYEWKTNQHNNISGLLINSATIFNFVLVIFVIAGFMCTTVTEYYASYSKFLRQVIRLVDEVVGYHQNESERETAIDHTSCSPVDGSDRQFLITENGNALYKTVGGLTYIKMEFFDLIVQKYMPYGTEIVRIFSRLFICGMIIYIGVNTLKSIGAMTSLNEEVSSIPFIFIPLVIPIFYQLHKNRSEEKNCKKIRKARIKTDIKQYLMEEEIDMYT